MFCPCSFFGKKCHRNMLFHAASYTQYDGGRMGLSSVTIMSPAHCH